MVRQVSADFVNDTGLVQAFDVNGAEWKFLLDLLLNGFDRPDEGRDAFLLLDSSTFLFEDRLDTVVTG